MTIHVLESERLLLRGFLPSDAAAVQQLAGAFEIADTTTNTPHPYEDGMAESWIEHHPTAYKRGVLVPFAITRKHDSALMGAISLMSIEQGHQAEIGYWIGKPFWGQGVCSEATQLVVQFAFSSLNLVRLYARYFSRNPASGRVLVNAGFVHEGTRRGHVKKWGILEDSENYGLLRGEWEASNP